jgi:hypothetical protein
MHFYESAHAHRAGSVVLRCWSLECLACVRLCDHRWRYKPLLAVARRRELARCLGQRGSSGHKRLWCIPPPSAQGRPLRQWHGGTGADAASPGLSGRGGATDADTDAVSAHQWWGTTRTLPISAAHSPALAVCSRPFRRPTRHSRRHMRRVRRFAQPA